MTTLLVRNATYGFLIRSLWIWFPWLLRRIVIFMFRHDISRDNYAPFGDMDQSICRGGDCCHQWLDWYRENSSILKIRNSEFGLSRMGGNNGETLGLLKLHYVERWNSASNSTVPTLELSSFWSTASAVKIATGIFEQSSNFSANDLILAQLE